MQRAWVTENSLLDGQMDRDASEFAARYEHADEGVRQGDAFRALCDTSKFFTLNLRYESRVARAYKRAIKTLEERRASRASASAARQETLSPGGDC